MSRWVVAAAGLGVVAGLSWWFGLGEVAATLRQASAGGLLAYGGLSVLVLLGYSGRWWLLTRTLGAPLRLGRCASARLAGDAVGMLVPSGKLAGEPLRVGLVRAEGVPLDAATAGVALDRMLELIGNSLAALVYVAVFLAVRGGGGVRHASLGLAATMLVLLAALLSPLVTVRRGGHPFALLPRQRLRRALPRLAPWLDALQRVEAHLTRVFLAHPRAIVVGIVASLLTELLVVGQYHALLTAFGVHLDLPTLLLVLLGGGLSRAVPTPGGLGALEATQTVLVGAASGRPDLGFVVGVLVRLHETLWLGVGLVALSLRGVSLARPTPGAAAATRAEP